MNEFYWRLPQFGRFSDWAITARLEAREAASTYSGTVAVIDPTDGSSAGNYTGSYTYDSNSQAWADYVSNWYSWISSVSSSAAAQVTSCTRSLATYNGNEIKVASIPVPPMGTDSVFTSGQALVGALNTADAGYSTAVTVTVGAYSSNKTSAIQNGDDAGALARAKYLVEMNKYYAEQLVRITNEIKNAPSWLPAGLLWVYYHDDVVFAGSHTVDNLSELQDLHARFPNVVR